MTNMNNIAVNAALFFLKRPEIEYFLKQIR
jgi:hypothetical protein